MQLHWHINTTASALHAAAALASGRRLADERMREATAAPLARVCVALAGLPVSTVDCLRAAIPLARRHATTDGLVGAALSSLGHAEVEPPALAALSRAVGDLTSAVLRASPNLSEQLSLRMAPLREAWDARGPGFWKSLRENMGNKLKSIATADVLCVQPVLGGSGDAFPSQNSVAIETVLANPHFQLPEVVRLGWLLAQLYFRGDEADIGKGRLELVTAVLKAADDVELARCDGPTIRLALDVWHVSDDTAGQL